jgi:hypothetical protein
MVHGVAWGRVVASGVAWGRMELRGAARCMWQNSPTSSQYQCRWPLARFALCPFSLVVLFSTAAVAVAVAANG